jgi:hypothetical protein
MSQEIKRTEFKSVKFKAASIPIFSEVLQRTNWVYYGENNLLPEYFINLYDNCAIHKSVITSKVNQIMGDGLVSHNNPMSVINLVNPYENISEIMKKASLDFMMFGGFALNIIWSNDRKSIAEIYHLDFSKVRSGKLNDEDKVEHYYYSADWKQVKKFPPIEIKAFNQKESDPNQILYFKTYIPGMSYYPVPDWSAGQRAIEIDIETKNFHMNNLRSGMVPSLFINMNGGIPGEEEQRILTRALEEQYAGTDNAGQAIISFNESKETAPEIIQIPRNDNDSYYQTLNDDVTRNILSSHRVSSAELFGIATPGKLGGADEITQHSEYFRKMVIQPYQNEILPVFNKLLSLKFEKPTTLDVKPLTIFPNEGAAATSQDDRAQQVLDGINSLSPLVANKVLESMTPNEIRALVNLDPTPEGAVIPNVTDVNQTDIIAGVNAEATPVNEHIKGLKGREYQNMMRIIREYNKGKITREQASHMLMSGYGLAEEDLVAWLGEEELNYN